MFTRPLPKQQKRIVETSKGLAVLFGHVGAGFFAGGYFQAKHLDNTNFSRERHNIILADSISRLQTLLRHDSVSRWNFINQNSHYLMAISDTIFGIPDFKIRVVPTGNKSQGYLVVRFKLDKAIRISVVIIFAQLTMNEMFRFCHTTRIWIN